MKASTITRDEFASVVRRYARHIFNAAFRIVNDYEDAMDVTQSTFVKAYERIDRYDPSRNIFNWLYKIAVHESINLAKRKSRTVSLDENLMASSDMPDEIFAHNETSRQIHRALRSLSLDYRIVLVLRHFQNLSYCEIASILDIPEKKVKSRLFTGRRLLKHALTKQGYAP